METRASADQTDEVEHIVQLTWRLLSLSNLFNFFIYGLRTSGLICAIRNDSCFHFKTYVALRMMIKFLPWWAGSFGCIYSRTNTMKGAVQLWMLPDKDNEKGVFITEQSPFCSLQTACANYRGNLDAQLLRAQGKLQKASDFVSYVRKTSDKNTPDNRTQWVVMCSSKGCTHGYCSDRCRIHDTMNNGHCLTCTGGDRDSTYLTREFLTHVSKTNDLFTAGLAVVAKLISMGLSRAADEGNTARNENIRALEHNLRPQWNLSRTAVLVTVENSLSKMFDELNSCYQVFFQWLSIMISFQMILLVCYCNKCTLL
jgi:hypothetical protein